MKHKVMVLSGKGGVGKSTLTKELGLALGNKDFQVRRRPCPCPFAPRCLRRPASLGVLVSVIDGAPLGGRGALPSGIGSLAARAHAA